MKFQSIRFSVSEKSLDNNLLIRYRSSKATSQRSHDSVIEINEALDRGEIHTASGAREFESGNSRESRQYSLGIKISHRRASRGILPSESPIASISAAPADESREPRPKGGPGVFLDPRTVCATIIVPRIGAHGRSRLSGAYRRQRARVRSLSAIYANRS